MVSVYEIKKINAKKAKTEAMTSSNFYFAPISQTKLQNIDLLLQEESEKQYYDVFRI